MLWPSLITSASFLASDYTFNNTDISDISDSCPTSGFQILNSSIDQVSLGGYLPITWCNWNLTLPIKPSNSLSDQQVYRRYIEGVYDEGGTDLFVARTTTAPVNNILNYLSYPFLDSFIGVNIR
jgi:hypothetical protein